MFSPISKAKVDVQVFYVQTMGHQHWDVVIIGAGPAGGRVATHFAERGHSVLMLEEHEEIGRPFQCAGLVTPNAMKEVGLFPVSYTHLTLPTN